MAFNPANLAYVKDGFQGIQEYFTYETTEDDKATIVGGPFDPSYFADIVITGQLRAGDILKITASDVKFLARYGGGSSLIILVSEVADF